MTPTELLDMRVADVIDADPAVARVFIDRRMGCVGCTFAPFETVSEAARAYGIEPAELADSLARVRAPGIGGRHHEHDDH